MSEARHRIRGLLLEHWGLKLLSLVFATLLWIFVVGERRSEVSLSVPLELTGVPQNLVVVSRLPDAVRVRLSGPRTLLSALNPQQLSVELDLSDLQAGTSTFEDLPSRLKLPKRIEVTYVAPAAVTIEADQRARKMLAVRPRLKGEPRPGFRLGTVQVDPPEVEVEGAARALRTLKEIPTEVVDVSGLDDDMSRPVDLSFPDPTLRRTSRGQVDLMVTVVEERVDREFRQVAVDVPGTRWIAVPSGVDVRVEGGARAIAALNRGDLSVSPEGGARALNRGPVRVIVRAPRGVKVLDVSPRTVELRPARGQAPPPQEKTDLDSSGGRAD